MNTKEILRKQIPDEIYLEFLGITMAELSASASANSIPVVGPQFCAPYPIDLALAKKVMTIPRGNFDVTDINGNLIFKVKAFLTGLLVLRFRQRRLLLDAAGLPIVTMRRKIWTLHSRWEVFRGDSTDPNDLLFVTKRSSAFQYIKTELDVFLANNTEQVVRDFKVAGSWFDRSCVVYTGESSTMVAKMHKKNRASSFFLGNDKYMVTVHPGMDHAFIVALLVILDDINTQD